LKKEGFCHERGGEGGKEDFGIHFIRRGGSLLKVFVSFLYLPSPRGKGQKKKKKKKKKEKKKTTKKKKKKKNPTGGKGDPRNSQEKGGGRRIPVLGGRGI